LVSRFVNCFFWAVVEHGEPEDIDRYLRVFGPLPGDRQAFRLEALALEAHGMWPEAHKAWKQFIDEVAANSADWPGEIGKRVQALIWARMADNADPAHRHRRGRSGNPLFDLFASHTAPLKPSPEQCLENAIKLAPDRLESYRALFEVYRQENKLNKAKKVGQELLKRFPDHAETLDALGVLCMDTRDYKKAQEFFEKAIQANPLDRNLRIELARSRQRYGLELTVQKKFDQAREQYDEALKNWDGAKTQILCQWAIAEIKADDSARADELIAQALAEPDRRLACRYALVGESVRAKLTAAQKKKIAQNLKDALAQAPTPAEILVLLISAAQQRIIHEGTFHGQKTQEKTILKFLESVQFDAFEEPQMEQIAVALETMQAFKPWMNCLNHARRRFLKNPFFRLSYVDYYLMGSATRQPNIHLAREHLDHARRLVQEMPRGERQQQYLDQIQDKEAIIAKFNARGPSMMDAFSGFFNGGFGPPFEDEDDFYDYEDED
jgi:tetratricopeptide (TPR) repeat protein